MYQYGTIEEEEEKERKAQHEAVLRELAKQFYATDKGKQSLAQENQDLVRWREAIKTMDNGANI